MTYTVAAFSKIDTHTLEKVEGRIFLELKEKSFFATFTPSMNEPVARAEAITIVRKREKVFPFFLLLLLLPPPPLHIQFSIRFFATVTPNNNYRPTSVRQFLGWRGIDSWHHDVHIEIFNNFKKTKQMEINKNRREKEKVKESGE